MGSSAPAPIPGWGSQASGFYHVDIELRHPGLKAPPIKVESRCPGSPLPQIRMEPKHPDSQLPKQG